MSWTRAKLSDLCTDIIDCVNKTAPKSPVETPYKMIRTSDIKDGVINLEGLFSVTEDTFKKWTRRGTLQLGDVILTREAPIGEVGIVKEPNNIFLGQRLVLYRTDRKKCDPRFLLYSLMYSENKKAIIAKGSGATVPHLRVPECEKIEISIPDLEMQHRIADILSAYDDLIENNKRQIKLLEEAAQRLYREWFVDLHFPGYENTKITDGVPEGWKIGRLVDVAEITMGQSPKSEYFNQNKDGLPFHQGVGSYGERFVKNEIYSSKVTRLAMPNSILFSVRAPVGRLNLTKEKIVIGRGLAAIHHKEGFQSFLFYLLKERFYKDNLIGNGSIFSSITKNKLRGLSIVIPNIELVRSFDMFGSKVDKLIQLLDAEINQLTEIRNHLLPKLMNGEMEV